MITGGLVRQVQTFQRAGLNLLASQPFMLMIDDPAHIDANGAHLPLPNNAPWPRQKIVVPATQGSRALIGLEQSFAQFQLLIPAGRQLSFRWSFYNCDPAAGGAGGTDFAFVELRHQFSGQTANLVLAIGARMSGVRTGDPATGWTQTRWPQAPQNRALPLVATFMCCSGAEIDRALPAVQQNISGPWSWPSAWLAFPSVLFLDGFRIV